MPKLIIGFTGPKRAGKTHCANVMCELVKGTGETKMLAFATPLKELMSNFFELTHEQLHTYEGKETIDPRYGVTPRRIMEAFGTDFVRGCTPDLWVIKMKNEILTTSADYVFIHDIRFDTEADLIRELGGTIVHLYGMRNNNPGKTPLYKRWLLPRSERGVEVMRGDLVMENLEYLDPAITTARLDNIIRTVEYRLSTKEERS